MTLLAIGRILSGCMGWIVRLIVIGHVTTCAGCRCTVIVPVMALIAIADAGMRTLNYIVAVMVWKECRFPSGVGCVAG